MKQKFILFSRWLLKSPGKQRIYLSSKEPTSTHTHTRTLSLYLFVYLSLSLHAFISWFSLYLFKNVHYGKYSKEPPKRWAF